MAIEDDLTGFPGWAPRWLRKMVAAPDCTGGTHPALRRLAKWLVIYMPPDECEGLALKWLQVAADRCDRDRDDGELARLITFWTGDRTDDDNGRSDGYLHQAKVDLDRIYSLIVAGPTRHELREMSQLRLYDTKDRNTGRFLDDWSRFSGLADPWTCYGSKDYFFTRRLSEMRARAHAFEQIVPSPMRGQKGRTLEGKESEHSLDGTGPRLFLVVEFDFAPVNKKREPTIWAPLIKACAEQGRDVLDMNAALVAYLRNQGPLWMVIYSGGKSLQPWFLCRQDTEESLSAWFHGEALPLGACRSTWCRSQFVRMPDGERQDGNRQSIEFIDPRIFAAYESLHQNI